MNENENPSQPATTPNPYPPLPPQPAPQAPAFSTPTVAGEPIENTVSQSHNQPNAYSAPQTSNYTWKEPFNQRIGRLGYLIGHLYLVLLMLAIFAVVFILVPALSFLDNSPIQVVFNVLLYILGIAVIAISVLVQLSLLVRRIHDLGHPWYWLFLSFIPLIGFLFSFYLLLAPGQKETNEWGEPVSSLDFLTVLGFKSPN